MQPDPNKAIINDNINLIKNFLNEIVIYPKGMLRKWASITKQTPAIKLGYIGQHLASLITGVSGTGTGARGDDLADGSEVKSCNKIDQADKCKSCGSRVMRFENICSECGSSDIERKDDSKWLFTIRDEHELIQYLNMDRVVLLLMDYPGFDDNNFNDIRISCYEIYPKNARMSVFCDLITNYYNNIYLRKLEANQKTNPMNLHPFGFQFYKCNPILVFSCTIKDIDTNPSIVIDEEHYVAPLADRTELPSLLMPSKLLKRDEWNTLLAAADYETEIKPVTQISKEEFIRLNKAGKEVALPFLNEKLRSYIPLRDIVSTLQHAHYQRR